jgi:hypothetical protein
MRREPNGALPEKVDLDEARNSLWMLATSAVLDGTLVRQFFVRTRRSFRSADKEVTDGVGCWGFSSGLGSGAATGSAGRSFGLF